MQVAEVYGTYGQVYGTNYTAVPYSPTPIMQYSPAEWAALLFGYTPPANQYIPPAYAHARMRTQASLCSHTHTYVRWATGQPALLCTACLRAPACPHAQARAGECTHIHARMQETLTEPLIQTNPRPSAVLGPGRGWCSSEADHRSNSADKSNANPIPPLHHRNLLHPDPVRHISGKTLV